MGNSLFSIRVGNPISIAISSVATAIAVTTATTAVATAAAATAATTATVAATVTTTETTTATTSAAATEWTGLSGFSRIDLQLTATEIGTIKGFLSLLSAVVIHFNECEAA